MLGVYIDFYLFNLELVPVVVNHDHDHQALVYLASQNWDQTLYHCM